MLTMILAMIGVVLAIVEVKFINLNKISKKMKI